MPKRNLNELIDLIKQKNAESQCAKEEFKLSAEFADTLDGHHGRNVPKRNLNIALLCSLQRYPLGRNVPKRNLN